MKRSLARLAAVVGAGLLLIAGGAVLAAPAAAETSPYLQSNLTSHNLRGTGVSDTQTFYVYLRAGEVLKADAGALTGTENPVDTYTIGLRAATVTVTDPSGVLLETRDNMSLFDGDTKSAPILLAAQTEGTYVVTVGPKTARYGNAVRPWRIEVFADGVQKPGRVFVTQYQLAQPTMNFTQSLTFWAVSEAGYQYRVDLPNYNGWNSLIRANAFGSVDTATCQPTYASDLATVDDITEQVAACGGSYLLFFDAPSADLPTSAPIPAQSPLGAGHASHWLMPDLQRPTVTNLAFQYGGSSPSAGTLTWDVANHTGTYLIRIDADGDGTYDGPLDRTVTQSTAIGTESYVFDGLDATGAAIPAGTPVGLRVEIEKAAEIHLPLTDVETMQGGVIFTRQNGDDIASDRAYWNDSAFTGPGFASCGGTPAVVNALPTGVPTADGGKRGWLSTNGTCNDSNSPYTGSWGNQRTVDTWTYGKVDVAGELRIGGVASFTLVKKTKNGTSFVAGDSVQYAFDVTNTGTSALTNVTIDDALLGLTGFVCLPQLAVGATASCDAPAGYTTTDADATAGTVRNTATAHATPGQGAAVPEDQTAFVDVTVAPAPVPGISLIKNVDKSSVVVGGSVSYSFTVKNTGQTPLTSVTIKDPLLALDGFVCATELAVEASATCDAPAALITSTVGTLTNTASATGTAPSGTVSADAHVDVTVTAVGTTTSPSPSATPGTALPVTGTGPATGLAATGGLILLAGGILVAIMRRRSRV